MTYPHTPGFVAGSITSLAAAVSVIGSSASIREQVFDAIQAAMAYGKTCDELEADGLGRHQTVSARIRELAMAGRIRVSGRRKTRSGRWAIVYIA